MRTRRQVLAGLGATALLPIASRSAVAAGPPCLVVIRLRGGLDGLAAVVPHADPDYRARRGRLALGRPGQRGGVRDLDGRVGLHPALPTLAELWQSGELVVAPAVATAYRGRSHGEAEAALAAAMPSIEAEAGDPLPSIDLAADLASTRPDLACRIVGADVQDRLRDDARQRHRRFVAAARRAGCDIAQGRATVALDCPGFDTHAGQGAATGRLAGALATLDAGVAALRDAAGGDWRRVALAIVTEFGRSVAPNADAGTDHGLASAAFLAGGRVGASRVLGGRLRLDEDVIEPQLALEDLLADLA